MADTEAMRLELLERKRLSLSAKATATSVSSPFRWTGSPASIDAKFVEGPSNNNRNNTPPRGRSSIVKYSSGALRFEPFRSPSGVKMTENEAALPLPPLSLSPFSPPSPTAFLGTLESHTKMKTQAARGTPSTSEKDCVKQENEGARRPSEIHPHMTKPISSQVAANESKACNGSCKVCTLM